MQPGGTSSQAGKGGGKAEGREEAMRQRRKRGQRREVTAPRGKRNTESRDKGQGDRQAARQPHASWAGTSRRPIRRGALTTKTQRVQGDKQAPRPQAGRPLISCSIKYAQLVHNSVLWQCGGRAGGKEGFHFWYRSKNDLDFTQGFRRVCGRPRRLNPYPSCMASIKCRG